MVTIKRHFELKLSYTSQGSFDVKGFDVVMADDLVQLLAQFMVLIGSVHRKILEEELTERGHIKDDDIPF